MIREEEGSVYWVSDCSYLCLGNKKVVLDNIVEIIVSHELMTIYVKGEETPLDMVVYWYFNPKECEDDYCILKDALRNRGKIFENIETDDDSFGVCVK